MLITISLLTALAFAAIYPLCFLISLKEPLKNNFHKLHIGPPNTVGGIVLVFVWLMDLPLSLKIIVTIWKAVLLSVSMYSRKKEYPNPKLISLPCVIGIFAFIRMQAHMIDPGWPAAFIGVLSGLILCCALFAMNLGRWYLNVHGLPMFHLTRAVNIFWILLGIRALWDLYFLFFRHLLYSGDAVTIARFITKIDGFPLMIGLFFGTLFPLIALYFVREALKLKNIQPATSILYVILCAIIIGDITYKYYLIKYGVFL